MFKAPLELKKELDIVRLERLRLKKDNEFKTYERLGLAIARHKQLIKDLMLADLPEYELK